MVQRKVYYYSHLVISTGKDNNSATPDAAMARPSVCWIKIVQATRNYLPVLRFLMNWCPTPMPFICKTHFLPCRSCRRKRGTKPSTASLLSFSRKRKDSEKPKKQQTMKWLNSSKRPSHPPSHRSNHQYVSPNKAMGNGISTTQLPSVREKRRFNDNGADAKTRTTGSASTRPS